MNISWDQELIGWSEKEENNIDKEACRIPLSAWIMGLNSTSMCSILYNHTEVIGSVSVAHCLVAHCHSNNGGMRSLWPDSCWITAPIIFGFGTHWLGLMETGIQPLPESCIFPISRSFLCVLYYSSHYWLMLTQWMNGLHRSCHL